MIFLLFLACTSPAPPAVLPFEQRTISADKMAQAFPSDRVKDRSGWASDLRAILNSHHLGQTNGNTCAVVAVLEQESGFVADPAVPGIGNMIDTWIQEKEAGMGAIPGWAFEKGLKAVLEEKPEGKAQSFYDRLHSAKTERDVDRTFRDFIEYQRAKLPKPLKVAEAAAQAVGLDMDRFNPISTSGCMQVKVDFSEAHAKAEGLSVEDVRESLYTRQGCMHYGTVRLLDWEAKYDKQIYRFSDYNVGVYASRNAAFQEQLATVSGISLALDGDLLIYGKGGQPSAQPSQTLQALMKLTDVAVLDLSNFRLSMDLSHEKELAFEETETYQKVRAHYQQKTQKEPVYARVPDVHLDSIKISSDKTTKWYATNVEKRYNACLARLK